MPTPANRLVHESSPYLLQHCAGNPVDWFPWGEEAFAKAKREDKPIFLSVGYAACHWCHVMERESFEDDATAALLNEQFVSIKVDREERPDIDGIYMTAVQAMNDGHGGWPMSVFLTPEGTPFFAGTYFPNEPRGGMPSFVQVLEGVAAAWRDRRSDGDPRRSLQRTHPSRERVCSGSTPPIDQETLTEAPASRSLDLRSATRRNDGAPKFPQPMVLEFLLRIALALTAVSRHGRADARTDGRRRDPGPDLRRLLSLCRRRGLAGTALREDAVRQCGSLRWCTCTAGGHVDGSVP